MTAARVLTRKARWPSVVSCGHHVNVGEVIVRRDRGWICRACALAIVRAAPYTAQTSATTVAAAPTEGEPQ